MSDLQNSSFYTQIVALLQSARQKVVGDINQTMVITYFEIGRKIVEEEQNGKERAEYGKSLLKELSKVLTKEFGKGFSIYNLERMRKFYFTYKHRNIVHNISVTVLRKSKTRKSATLLQNFELSWSYRIKKNCIFNANFTSRTNRDVTLT